MDLTTNGLVLKPALSDRLIEAGLGTIRISIQGINADMYWNICRVRMDFDDFLDNLRYLYANRGKTKVRLKIADIAIKGVPDGEKRFIDIFGSVADSVFVEHIMPIYSTIDYNVLDKNIVGEALGGRGRVAKQKSMRFVIELFIAAVSVPMGISLLRVVMRQKMWSLGMLFGKISLRYGMEKKESFLKQQLLG